MVSQNRLGRGVQVRTLRRLKPLGEIPAFGSSAARTSHTAGAAHSTVTAEAALSRACGGVVGKARVKQEIIQGTLDLALDQLIIAAALPDAILGLRKCEDVAVLRLDSRAVDI